MNHRKTSPLLINEAPLQVLPSLVKAIGLNEAIILQQLHYWISRSNHVHDGRRWVYNSYEAWQEQISYLSTRTIRRIFASLEKQNLILTGNFNRAKFDQTKWYTIDYDKLDAATLTEEASTLAEDPPSGQPDKLEPATVGHMHEDTAGHMHEDTAGQLQRPPLSTPIPIDYTEITDNRLLTIDRATEPKADQPDQAASTPAIYKEVINHLNEVAGTKYRPASKATQTLIRARQREGFTLDDFKTVIDKKTKEWKGGQMEKFIRPETLFGTKFEGYLNQEIKEDKPRFGGGYQPRELPEQYADTPDDFGSWTFGEGDRK